MPDPARDIEAPRVSAVMPAFEAEAHIGGALSSVLAQDWPGLEVVVVDDGSTDGTAAVAERTARDAGRPIRLIRQANAGAGAARDAGIAAARGELILLADADDTMSPGLVSALVAHLDRTGADLAYALCRYVDGAGAVRALQEPQPERPTPVDLLNGIMVNSPLVRREAILAVGGHDPALRGSIDLDLILRIAMRRPGAIATLNETLSDYRRDDGTGQITSNWRNMRAGWMAARDKAMAAGLRLDAAQQARMIGRKSAFWATIAYMAGEHRDARRLIATALRLAPGHVARDPMARLRVAACLATLLPRPLHDAIRTRFNARPRA